MSKYIHSSKNNLYPKKYNNTIPKYVSIGPGEIGKIDPIIPNRKKRIAIEIAIISNII